MILEFLENVVILIMPIVIFYLIIKSFMDFKGKHDVCSSLKHLFCIFLTVAIFYSISIIMVFDIYFIASVLQGQDIASVVKSISFIAIEFTWEMIGVVLLFFVWKIPKITFIPGEGTIKERFVNLVKKVKVKK